MKMEFHVAIANRLNHIFTIVRLISATGGVTNTVIGKSINRVTFTVENTYT